MTEQLYSPIDQPMDQRNDVAGAAVFNVTGKDLTKTRFMHPLTWQPYREKYLPKIAPRIPVGGWTFITGIVPIWPGTAFLEYGSGVSTGIIAATIAALTIPMEAFALFMNTREDIEIVRRKLQDEHYQKP